MAKSNFLLVDLNEPKTKKLAETITSETSRKILNHLAEKEDTEANIAKSLILPISTVHYHLQKLQEAQLITVDEFHYSSKGREVNHYKLANKYIIIAPQKISGLREKLKGILPVSALIIGISVVLKVIESKIQAVPIIMQETAMSATAPTIDAVQQNSLPFAAEVSQEVAAKTIDIASAVPTSAGGQETQALISTLEQSPSFALWFLIGAMTTILLYVLFVILKEKISQKK